MMTKIYQKLKHEHGEQAKMIAMLKNEKAELQSEKMQLLTESRDSLRTTKLQQQLLDVSETVNNFTTSYPSAFNSNSFGTISLLNPNR